MKRVVVLQTCIPDYRLEFFRQLHLELKDVCVFGGSTYFSAEIKTAAKSEPWYTPKENRFFFGRTVLWQEGVVLASLRADTVVCEWNPRILSTWWTIVLRRVLKKRTLCWGHVTSRARPRCLSRIIRSVMARLSNGVIAYTSSEAVACRKSFPGLPVWTAANSAVREDEVRQFSGGAQKLPSSVIYVGRLTDAKKPLTLLRAWKIIAQKVPNDTRLILVGDGPVRTDLEESIRAMQLEERVVVVGHVSDLNCLRTLYANAFVAVSPGYVGLSVIQCHAFGVPMIVSRYEDHSPEIEACRENFNCRFFETDNIEALAGEIWAMYCERSAWMQRRSQIAQHVLHYYTIEKMVAGFKCAIDAIGSSEERPAVAMVWEQYGPYHSSRFAAFAGASSKVMVAVPIEMAARTSTYAWERDNSSASVHALEVRTPVETLGFVAVYMRAVRFFRKAGIRVVFVPSYWPARSLAILCAAWRVGAKTVMMNESHEQTSRATGMRLLLKRRLARAFDAAFVGGQLQRKYFESLGIKQERIFEGYDAVDNEFFRHRAARCRENASNLRAEYHLPHSYFVSIGRMEEKKNLGMLVKAYAIALGHNPALPKLVFVGSGQMENELRSQCRREGLQDVDMRNSNTRGAARSKDVLFYGFRQIAELPVFYSLATAFVLPSVREEWGLVVNEAMASGIPVIVSKVAGCAPDLVIDGKTGYAFDPLSPDELAECLLRVADDPIHARRMGIEADRAIEQWGLQTFAENACRAASTALRGGT